MPHDFVASSFAEHLILYDPAAIPDDFPFDPDVETPEPAPPPATSIQHLANTGQAFIISIPEGDCEARIRVFAEEPLPGPPDKPGMQSLVGAQIEIPSGRLKADGIEFVHCEHNAREHGNHETMSLKPGTYNLEVIEQIAWKDAHREPYVKSHTTLTGRRISKLINCFTFSYVVFFIASILILPGVIGAVWVKFGSDAGLIGIALLVGTHIVCLALFRIVERAGRRWPAIMQPAAARDLFDRDHPDVLVALRRASADSHSTTPSLIVIQM